MEEAMFGKRCSLCGGKLNSNGICTECGLDNNKSDKNYRINQSECDHEPLTHVHYGKNEKPETQDYTRSDPYENVTKELPADGESVSFELTSGDYVVGVHIPEGNYQADVSYDYDTVQVDDWDSGFYLYEYAGRTDGDYLDDLRLYNGAIVHISSQTTITLYSDNAQTENILYENNPLAGQEPLVVKKDLTVGPDLLAGVYDLILVSGEGSVDVDIYTEYGESMETKNLYLGENCTDGKEYKNLVLPKNAQITLDDNMELRLTPSEHISTTDYYEYYNY